VSAELGGHTSYCNSSSELSQQLISWASWLDLSVTVTQAISILND